MEEKEKKEKGEKRKKREEKLIEAFDLICILRRHAWIRNQMSRARDKSRCEFAPERKRLKKRGETGEEDGDGMAQENEQGT